MSWEIEREEVDKAEGVHRYTLIERGVLTRDGEPARYHYWITLGTGTDGESCHHCNQPVKREVSLGHEGKLHHHTRGEVSPHDLVKEKIQELNDFHTRMDHYIKKHKTRTYKGPAK